MRQVAIVACSKMKLDRPAAAGNLYTSALFKKSFALAELLYDDALILSAKHGVLAMDTVIEPYDVTLKGMTHTQHCEWADRVTRQLKDRYTPESSLLWSDYEFIVFGGEAYWCLLGTTMKTKCAWPEGLGGIGGVLRWLNQQYEAAVSSS